MTELAKDFIQAEEGGPKKLITATWDDAPHLSPEAKAELNKSIPPNEREARTEGRAAWHVELSKLELVSIWVW